MKGKFEIACEQAVRLASRLRPEDGVAIVEVENPREGELILQMVLGMEPGQLLRERIYAVVDFQQSGLNVKRAGGDWETLTHLSGPAVLLVAPGIRAHVGMARGIEWGTVPVERTFRLLLEQTGCLILVVGVVAILLPDSVRDWLLALWGRLTSP